VVSPLTFTRENGLTIASSTSGSNLSPTDFRPPSNDGVTGTGTDVSLRMCIPRSASPWPLGHATALKSNGPRSSSIDEKRWVHLAQSLRSTLRNSSPSKYQVPGDVIPPLQSQIIRTLPREDFRDSTWAVEKSMEISAGEEESEALLTALLSTRTTVSTSLPTARSRRYFSLPPASGNGEKALLEPQRTAVTSSVHSGVSMATNNSGANIMLPSVDTSNNELLTEGPHTGRNDSSTDSAQQHVVRIYASDTDSEDGDGTNTTTKNKSQDEWPAGYSPEGYVKAFGMRSRPSKKKSARLSARIKV
jgi:hypothetical protein